MDVATLGLKVDSTGVRRATSDLERFGRQGQKAEGSAKRMGAAIGKAVAAFGGIALSGATFGRFVRTVGDFETSMSKVAAISGATDTELARLRDTAKELGATTRFSASQAAEGLGFLAMAGFSATDAIEAMPGVLDMAAAGGMDLARAADIASNVLSGFGMAAEEATRVSDVLAKAAASSNTSIEQLGGAMSYAAPAAAAIGEEVEMTAAAIGVLSDAGIQGQRAGVAVANVMSRMVSPTKAAREALDSLGLTAADVNVEQHGLQEVMERLSEAGIGLAEANEIVGVEMGKALLVMTEGADKMGLYEEALLNAEGAAKGMSDTISDNLDGDLKQLNSAIEGLIINIGETGATGGLRSIVQGITDLIRAASDWEHLDKIVMALGGIAVAAAAAVFPVGAAVAALTVGAIYIGSHWEDLAERFPGIVGTIEAAMPVLGDVARSEVNRVRDAFNGLLTGIENVIASVQSVFAGSWAQAWETAKSAVLGFAEFARNANPINALADAVVAGAGRLGSAIAGLWEQAIAPAVEGWADRMVGKGRDLVDGINRGIGAAAGRVRAALANIWETIKAEVAGWATGLVQSGRDLIDGYVQGIREKAGEVASAVSSVFSGGIFAGKKAQDSNSPAREYIVLGRDAMAGYVEGVGAMADDVANSVKDVMKGAISEADKAERELKARSDRIIDSVSNNLLKGNGDLTDVWGDIKDAGVDAFTGILKESFAPGGDGIKGVMNGLSGAFQGVMQGLSTGGIGGIMSAVSSALPIIGAVVGAINLIKGFYTKETIATGVTGTIGMDSVVKDFERTRHKILWGLIKWTSETETHNSQLTELMRDRSQMVRSSIVEIGETIGATATNLSGIVQRFKIDAKDMDADEIKQALSDQVTAYGDQIAQAIVGSEEFLRAGESYLDALKRMAEALPTVNAALETLGHQMFNISVIGADAASAVAELFGGVENFAQSADLVFQRFYRESERVELLTSKLTRELAGLGLAMPETRREFRFMLEAQNLMTESGRRAYATLMQMAGSFDVILPKFEDVAGSVEAANAALDTLISEALSEATSAAREARRVADEFERLFETLSDGARQLRMDALPAQRAFAEQQAEFGRVMGRAMSGDQDAMGEVTGAAASLQSAFANRARTGVELALYTARLAAQVQDVAGVAQEMAANKSIEAQTLDRLVEQLNQGEVTHDLLRENIAALDGMNVGVVNKLIEVRDALSNVTDAEKRASKAAAGAAADAATRQLAQITAEAQRAARQLANTSVPERVRITGSQGKWIGASWAETSDGKRFTDIGKFNTAKELQVALDKARAYVDSRNAKVETAIATRNSLEERLALLRQQARDLGAVPGFATGGMHSGGMRLVGERGPELEVTGPSRIYSAQDTRQMIDNREVVKELQEVRKELAEIRASARRTATSNEKIERTQQSWDQFGIPEERTT